MVKRRQFIKLSGLVLPVAAVGNILACSQRKEVRDVAQQVVDTPVVISTWNHGIMANNEAWKVLSENGNALDAVEKGVRVIESDPENKSVGIGGYPDRDGNVTLDASIMDHQSNCGSVAFLQHIQNPISVARLVMEKTPHVMLAGTGALQFALENGFNKEDLLTAETKKEYEEWLKDGEYKPVINIENHDTIGMLALDSTGNLSGSCTTSGAAWKMHGRVGDAPIIGAGLFVDNEVGAACATGLGEAVMKVSGSAMVVEMMRQGLTPFEACKQIVERIVDKHDNARETQVGLLALNKSGEYGGYSINKGFDYAVYNKQGNNLIDAVSKY